MFLGIVSIILGLVALLFSSRLGILLLFSRALWATVCVALCLITSGILAIVNRCRPHHGLLFGCAIANAAACVICAFSGSGFYLPAFFMLLFVYYMFLRRKAISDAEAVEDDSADRQA